MRYATPLREGGSLPGIVEADDGQMYAMKFIGAGQGRKALIAELVAGEISRALGELNQAERFRWLTSPRSTTIQASPAHCGLCDNPETELARLFEEMPA